MPPDFQILETLQRHGVRFVVIGGHAVNAHGFRRVTEDIDLLWLRSPQSEEALLRALTELEAGYLAREIDPKTRIERVVPVTASYLAVNHLMMLWTRHGFLDLFDHVPGLASEPVELVIATSVEIDGVRYASLDYLRRMKKASARTKDLLDLENLPE